MRRILILIPILILASCSKKTLESIEQRDSVTISVTNKIDSIYWNTIYGDSIRMYTDRIDSILRSSTHVDSTFIHDSIYIKETDSVREVYKYVYKYKYIKDTEYEALVSLTRDSLVRSRNQVDSLIQYISVSDSLIKAYEGYEKSVKKVESRWAIIRSASTVLLIFIFLFIIFWFIRKGLT